MSTGDRVSRESWISAYFETVVLLARRSSSSIAVVSWSIGTTPEKNRPLTKIAGVPLTPAASPSTGRRYGLARVCRVLETARSTVYAARTRRLAPVPPRKRGPKTAFTDAELTEQIRNDEASRRAFTDLAVPDLLQRYRDGGLSDAVAFRFADGLSWALGGESGRVRTESDLSAWRAARGAAGRMPPLGFPRSNKFG